MKKYVLLFIGIVTLISISVLSSNAFFSGTSTAQGTITLKELNFSIIGEEKNIYNVMPGDYVNLKYSVINSRNINGTNYQNLTDFYFRFSLNLFCNSTELSYNLSIPNKNDYFVINDTYYYLKPITQRESVELFDGFKLDINTPNSCAGQKIDFDLVVEAVQASEDAVFDVWPEIYDKIYK